MMKRTTPCLLSTKKKLRKNDKVIFCGRLADYKYYDMHVVIERALEVVANELIERNHNLWNNYLKEEFLHDINAKNAGNKARNDVESIVKEEGYHPLVLSVDNWYQMSTPWGPTP